jgi:hypothetical protein
MVTGRTAWAARTAREGKDSETRSSLLACAGRVFARLGYARTTIADITDEAEVSRATFYVYWSSQPSPSRCGHRRVDGADGGAWVGGAGASTYPMVLAIPRCQTAARLLCSRVRPDRRGRA